VKHQKSRARPKAELPKLTPSLPEQDRDAFERAIEMMRQHSPARAAQIDDTLTREGLTAGGEFAAYFCQCETLRLKPWQAPPSHVRGDVPDPNVYGARPGEIELRDRLAAAGLSVFEPDPVQALARAARKGAA
jgi:hypothetical protein